MSANIFQAFGRHPQQRAGTIRSQGVKSAGSLGGSLGGARGGSNGVASDTVAAVLACRCRARQIRWEFSCLATSQGRAAELCGK